MRNSFVALALVGLLLLCCCGSGASAPPPPPNLQISPTSVSFGVVALGSQSTAQAETLSNSGGSELVISSITIGGSNAADFSQASTCTSALGASATCTVDLTFTPSQLGPRRASLVISDNGVDGQQTLSLTGDGGDSGPNATLSPTRLSFSDQDIGTTSAAQAITLSNYGTATLDIADISARADFGETNNCNTTLASGASCTANVTFTPGGTGGFAGTLSVADGAPDSPQVVSLSGEGSTRSCRTEGNCYAGHPCCPGYVCVPASTRAFCERAEVQDLGAESWHVANQGKKSTPILKDVLIPEINQSRK